MSLQISTAGQSIARRLATDWHDGQNSASPRPQISGLTPAVPFREEGRSRVVTNAGRDVVDATASARIAVAGRVEPRERLTGAQDERRFSVRQNRVVLTPVAGAKSVVATQTRPGLRSHLNPPTTVTRRIRRRGERGISRKAITQGMPDASAEPVCSCAHFLVHLAHETAGAARTRHSLRPRIFEGEPCQASGASRRETVNVYLVYITAMRG
jgi:hypothetical protein